MYKISSLVFVHTAIERLQDFDEGSCHAGRGIELSGVFSFLLREVAEAVLIRSAEQVFLIGSLCHLYVEDA